MLTYEQCTAMIDSPAAKTHGRRKLANNTYLYKRGDHFAVQLHKTDVVEIYEDGTYVLNTGGWQTNTTKDRINEFSPANIYTDGGNWYVGIPAEHRDPFFREAEGFVRAWDYTCRPIAGGKYGMFDKSTKEQLFTFDTKEEANNFRYQRVPFYEGMKVDATGNPVDDVPEDAKKRLVVVDEVKGMVKDYINGFIDHIMEHGLADPGPGDCFGCSFPLGATPPIEDGKEMMGVDHYFSHFKEKYYVPSLLLRALKERYLRPEGVSHTWFSIRAAISRRDKGNVEYFAAGALRPFFKARMDDLVDNVMAVAPPRKGKRNIRSLLGRLG